ncbi:hypothetical protein LOCC1_G002560 [Lachnellula occidentalis]|uniref:EthD domain-containing protein n=1 Tax=Lachnellula occidentalis TaxID=215460 RepID=A0A8H8S601_9HELO|nr:hypothetical protein LOCC1_G002560 [Lachnellula occidentalis]
MAPTTVTFLYPVVPVTSKPFNFEYYLATHMPWVQKSWSKFGLQKWEVMKLDPVGGYTTELIMHWESLEAFRKALEEDSVDIMADIPNFSTVSPVQIWGDVVGGN